MGSNRTRWTGALLAFAASTMMFAPAADARRGGSFGSRGSHTFSSPSATRLSPGYVGPVSRSMSERPGFASPQYAPSYGSTYGSGFRQRPGFGGGLLTGLVTGGLIGAMLGHNSGGYGYGNSGGGGILALLVQLAILGGIVWLVLGFFRRSRAPRPPMPFTVGNDLAAAGAGVGAFNSGGFMGSGTPVDQQQIALTAADLAAFERLLGELQDAFGRGDFARLRAITTPEIMSYLAEELSENTAAGRRNDVAATRLLDAEVSEAWREQNTDYATIAMRYESIDVMRDRTTNAVLSGNPAFPTQTTELWTFVRSAGAWSDWKVSAIEES